MPLNLLTSGKIDFLGLTSDQFAQTVRDWDWPAFRAAQVGDWVYAKLVSDPAQMTNLGKLDRTLLTDRIAFTPATITAHQSSSDGTQKLLLTWPDGSNAETVMIPDG